ncbi:MAG: DUF5979 domain-containing protein, partial [Bifidobacterium sp.]
VVTIGKDSTVAVTVENPITKDVGRFSVTKRVTGDGASLVGKDVVFSGTYSYPAGDSFAAGSGTWSAKDGQTWTSGDLPVGAVVTVSEDKAADVAGGTWSDPKVSGVVTIGKDSTVAVTVENPISKDVVPPVPDNPATPDSPTTPSSPATPSSPNSPSSPSNPLAKTGTDIAVWSFATVLLLVAGAATITFARRRHNRE